MTNPTRERCQPLTQSHGGAAILCRTVFTAGQLVNIGRAATRPPMPGNRIGYLPFGTMNLQTMATYTAFGDDQLGREWESNGVFVAMKCFLGAN
jgi:hypothetical protein